MINKSEQIRLGFGNKNLIYTTTILKSDQGYSFFVTSMYPSFLKTPKHITNLRHLPNLYFYFSTHQKKKKKKKNKQTS